MEFAISILNQCALLWFCVQYADGGRTSYPVPAEQVPALAMQCAPNPTVTAIFVTDLCDLELARWERNMYCELVAVEPKSLEVR